MKRAAPESNQKNTIAGLIQKMKLNGKTLRWRTGTAFSQ